MKTFIELLVAGFLWVMGMGLPQPVSHAPASRYPAGTLNPSVIQAAKKFTVLISNEGFGPVSRGTGVLVDSRHVLTCSHVAAYNDEIYVYFYPGYLTCRGKVVRRDPSNDLALLEIDVAVNSDQYAVFQPNTYDGESITIIGNILGSMKWFVSYGIVSGRSKRDLFTDGLVLGGNSGGPWINQKGEVVALSDWGLEKNGKALGINGGISSTTILKFMEGMAHPSILDILQGVE